MPRALPLLLCLCACLPGEVGSMVDAGPDAALPPADAGHDAGADAGVDGGLPDAGAPDSGLPDSGTPDAGPTMAISVQGGHFVHSDGRLVDIRGAISCCGGGYGWPIFDEAWVDLVHAKGATFLHARLGPFLTQNPNGETDWAATGGGYVETNGKADLTQFNPVFWSRIRALLSYARQNGMYVEIDVADGWAIKHCKHGDIPGYSAWDSAFNVQGLDVCQSSGNGAIAPGSVQEAWVKQVAHQTADFDNVIYQDGNEVGLVGGYDPAWTTSIHDLLRAEEAALGVPPHPFGTNSGSATAMASASVDYGELHQTGPADASQCAGKPCLVNEYNPDPPLTPEQFQADFCTARDQGTTFWYWRHGQSDPDMLQSLTYLGSPCP